MLEAEPNYYQEDFYPDFLVWYKFSKAVKQQVRQKQKGICWDCGDTPRILEVHHRVPQVMKGRDTIDNAVGLCPPCHEQADWLALQGIIHQKVHGRR